MASKVYSEEQLNYFRLCHIATDILPPALRLLFKQEWDNRYKITLGEWNDTPQNGLDFKNGESADNQSRNAEQLLTMVNGNRAQWDCTMLFYAILHSDSIRPGLSKLIRKNVHNSESFEINSTLTGRKVSSQMQTSKPPWQKWRKHFELLAYLLLKSKQ